MKCFYHNADLDGHCSGAIVKYKYPECEMIGINYGDEFPWDDINEGKTVFMVDFCLQPFKDMIKLNSKVNLILIDHHKTTLENLYKYTEEFNFSGVVDITKAACELCWEYFFPNEKIPFGVKLLGRYDVWDLDYSSDVLPFQYAMRSYNTNLDSYV